MERIIHQMWFQGEENHPLKYRKWRNSWKKNNDNYQYIFWDEKSVCQLLEKDYPEYYEKYINIDKIIKKCDAARYFILHKYGGVYADLDTISYKPIDTLLNDLSLNDKDIVLSEESDDPLSWKSNLSKKIIIESNYKKVIGNAIIISKKGINFWLEFINKSFEIQNESVLKSFSTWHLTKFYQSTRENLNATVIPPSFLLNTKYKDDQTYAIHKYDATWFNYDKENPWEG